MRRLVFTLAILATFSVFGASRYQQLYQIFQNSKTRPSIQSLYENSIWQGRCVSEKSTPQFGADGTQKMTYSVLFVHHHWSTDEILGDSNNVFTVRQIGNLTERSTDSRWASHAKSREKATYRLKDQGGTVSFRTNDKMFSTFKVVTMNNKKYLMIHEQTQTYYGDNTICYFTMIESENKKQAVKKKEGGERLSLPLK